MSKASKKPTVRLFINLSSVRVDGAYPVTVVLTLLRERRYYPTGVAVSISCSGTLAEKREKFKTFTDRILTGSKINKAEKELVQFRQVMEPAIAELRQAVEIIRRMPIFTFGLFEQAYLANDGPLDSVQSGFLNYIGELRQAGKIGTAVIYECSMNSIESFMPRMKFGDITVKRLEEYERDMLTAGNSKATIGIYLRCLRAIYNQAEVDRVIYPFGRGKNKYTIPTGRNLKKALHLAEIAKIFNYQPTAGSTEEMCRDYWVFMYLCNGMNLKDMCLLKRSDISGDFITYTRAKTINSDMNAMEHLISLKPEAREVIQKWGQKTIDPEAYIFPHLKKDTSPVDEKKIVQQLTKTINKYMKRIAEKVEIDKPITTYYARHSFATVLKRSGISTDMISDLLRHKTTKTTTNYLAGFESDQIHEATNVLTAFNK